MDKIYEVINSLKNTSQINQLQHYHLIYMCILKHISQSMVEQFEAKYDKMLSKDEATMLLTKYIF